MKLELKNPIYVTAILLALITLAGFAVYANSLKSEFIWDDYHLIVNNSYLKSWSNIGAIFSHGAGAGAKVTYLFYRPIPVFTFMLNYSVNGLDPFGYHLVNILIHISVALALYVLSFILFKNKVISFLAGILFVVHPIHTETISYISSRADPLAALFMLLGLIFYIKCLETKKGLFYPLVLISFVLALLSKEGSFIFLPLVLLYHFAFRKKITWGKLLPIIAMLVAYAIVRGTIMTSPTSVIRVGSTVLQRLPGFFVAVASYARLILLPFDLHLRFAMEFFKYTDPKAIAGALILLTLIICAVRSRKTNSLVCFSVSWIFITLMPFSNIYILNAYMLEHWLYFPSVGIFLLAAWGINLAFSNKRLRYGAVFISLTLVCYFSCLTIKQNKYLQDNTAFFERTLQYLPNSFDVHTVYAGMLITQGKYQEAIKPLEKAVSILEKNILPGYKNEGKLDVYTFAMDVFTKTYLNCSIAYSGIGDYEKAEMYLKKLIQVNPKSVVGYERLARLYYDMGERDKSLLMCQKTLEFNNGNSALYNDLGSFCLTHHDYEMAKLLLEKAIYLNPSDEMAYFNLGNLHYRLQQNKKAIVYYEKAFAVISNNNEKRHRYRYAHLALAELYLNDGKYNLAVQHTNEARKLGCEIHPAFLSRLKNFKIK